MSDQVWKLANLSQEQIQKLKEVEPTLGNINILAFSPVTLQPASLNPSQVECLQGLEKILGVTLVAFQK